MRGLLNPSDQAGWTAQERAFGLLAPGITQLATVFAEASAAENGAGSPERTTTAIKIAKSIAQQLYFASGAFDARHQTPDEEPRRGDPCRFTALAMPALEGLTAIHFPAVTQHIVETADHIAHCDPRRLLLTAAAAANHDPGYANEIQGLETVLTLIRHYFAEHRDLVLNDTECTTAIRAMLGSFVSRGWDKAIDLAEELHDMYT
jgi:hypothetical protein